MTRLAMRDRSPQDFLLPARFFRATVEGLPPVPAYMFHQIDAADFEGVCRRIVAQRLKSLWFTDMLAGSAMPDRGVLLTLDDGWSSTWSVIVPLSRQYGLRWTLFLAPQCVEESDEVRSTLETGATAAELIERDLSARGRLTWGEVRALQASGVVQIQSHSSSHGVVFTGADASDFVRPADALARGEGASRRFPLNGLAPLICHTREGDRPDFHPPLGTPLHAWGPALAAPRRWLESGAAAETCQALVRNSGGTEFFQRPDWESQLRRTAAAHVDGAWESDEDRRWRYGDDLRRSREMIAARVPGADATVLAPPWAEMHADLPAIAKEVGFHLIVMGYPYRRGQVASPLPVYPRLFGDALWTHVDGPLLGGYRWMQARRHALQRRRGGAVP